MSLPHDIAPVNRPAEDPTIGTLVTDITDDLGLLVQKQIQLAKSELQFSVKAGLLGSALFVVAAVFALLILPLLSVAFAYFLTMTGLHPAWCFLIVAGAYLLIAIILIALGVMKLKKIKAPAQTIETVGKIPSALQGKRA